MLKVTEIDDSIVSVDYPAPSVYIDSCHIENIYNMSGAVDKRSITVNFHVADDLNYWHKSEEVINNLFVSMSCGESNYYSSLSSLMSINELHNGKLHLTTKFHTTASNISISACCCNDYLRGVEITEHILNNNTLVKNTYEADSLQYFNKYKDLSLLDITNLNTASLNKEVYAVTASNNVIYDYTSNPGFNDQKNVFSELFVSHNTRKNASFGFVFDLEKYLLNNSVPYRILKDYEDYKNIILSNSYILLDSIRFYKKNISKEHQEYKEIFNPSAILKLSDGIVDNRFIITSADFNEDKSINDKYAVKVSMDIFDYSQILLKDSILKNIKKAIAFIQRYKDIFISLQNNDVVDDVNKYIFENIYEKEIPVVTETIANLSHVFSFYTRKERQIYISLFVSLLHPLNTDTYYLDRLLEACQVIHDYIYRLIRQENPSGFELDQYGVLEEAFLQTTKSSLTENRNNNHITKKKNRSIEHYFEYTDIGGKKYYHEIDYNYDLNHGMEVLTVDNFDNRNGENISFLKALSVPQKNARKIYETNKFFNASSVPGLSLDHFSVMSFDIRGRSFDLQTFDTQSVSLYNELYEILKQYNENKQFNNSIEGQYFSLLDKNVNIKSISTRPNTSQNGLQKATIFDSNMDSKENSIKYMLDTGISSLQMFFDDNQFMEVPLNINQYYALYDTTSFNNSALLITDEIRKNPEAKGKLIISFNNFFKDKLLYAGQNYEIWELEESLLHDIFSKKLKLFNKYYILEKKRNNPYSYISNQENFDLTDDLMQSIRPKYINRTRQMPVILLTTEDI